MSIFRGNLLFFLMGLGVVFANPNEYVTPLNELEKLEKFNKFTGPHGLGILAPTVAPEGYPYRLEIANNKYILSRMC